MINNAKTVRQLNKAWIYIAGFSKNPQIPQEVLDIYKDKLRVLEDKELFEDLMIEQCDLSR